MLFIALMAIAGPAQAQGSSPATPAAAIPAPQPEPSDQIKPDLYDTDPADVKKADETFEKGLTLMEAGKLSEACKMLARSYSLDPATGTLMYLADCHEKRGALAEAMRSYEKAVNSAKQDIANSKAAPKRNFQLEMLNARRVVVAERKIGAIKPTLPRVVLLVSREVGSVPQLKLFLSLSGEQQRVRRSHYGKPVLVDPGRYQILAQAPKFLSWSIELDIAAPGQVYFIQVPMLTEIKELKRKMQRETHREAPPFWAPSRVVAASLLVLGSVGGVASMVLGISAAGSGPESQPGQLAAAATSIGLGALGVAAGGFALLTVPRDDHLHVLPVAQRHSPANVEAPPIGLQVHGYF